MNKACIYARVSTDHEEQDQSYNAQMNYFKEHYKEYNIVETYAEKESGTSIKNREEFKKMLIDAGLELEEKRGNINIYNTNKEPKFNYIITKSISRFARNTEIKSVIRKLQAQGVYIIFDDINKSTESKEDTLLLGILLQMAEEESNNKSKIIKWGKKRSAEANKIPMNISPYGYISDLENNRLIADPKESEVVKLIFDLYINGYGARKIKQILTEKGMFNREGKEFSESMIFYIIQNPKYCSLNVRNRFIKTDVFNQNKQIELNETEWISLKNERIDKIIEDETFEKAQEELNKRRLNGKGYRGFSKSKYSGKIKCACGGTYIHNTYYNKNGNKEIYVCNKRKKLGKVKSGCSSRNITQEELDNVIQEHLDGKYKKILLDKVNRAIKEICKKEKMINDNDISNIKTELNNINLQLDNNKIRMEKIIDMLLDGSNTKKDVLNNKIDVLEKENKVLENKKLELNNIVTDKETMLKNVMEFKELLFSIKNFKSKNKLTKESFVEDIINISLDKNNKIIITTKLMIILDTMTITSIKYNISQNFKNNFHEVVETMKKW